MMSRRRASEKSAMPPIAEQLASWSFELRPDSEDLGLADRSLLDTLAVTLAARSHPVSQLASRGGLGEAARWAVAAHVLDFDDLHLGSTTHISAVCVPVVLATGGDARAYLSAAGVMARLGNALGWNHYSAGWHATCTAGALAAAVGAAVAMGLNPTQIATAIAHAVPGAGGVQRAFGTDAKSLQVGFAVDTGIRAARLAAAGAQADPGALDSWLRLVRGDPDAIELSGPAVPGGLAIKIYPACYALQRPISVLSALTAESEGALDPTEVTRILLRTPEATVAPLIHHRPQTGLQAKFSLEYAAAAALLDGYPGFESFTDGSVQRREAQRLVELVEVKLDPGGDWLLDGELDVEVHTTSGEVVRSNQRYPPGSPQRPPTQGQLAVKLSDCLRAAGRPDLDPTGWAWDTAAALLRANL
jgi:2-methylcitrate dehydratase PrpD